MEKGYGVEGATESHLLLHFSLAVGPSSEALQFITRKAKGVSSRV